MSEENKMEPVTVATLIITGLAAAGKLILDGVAAAGARGQALYDLAVTGVATLAHTLEEKDPPRYKQIFDDARAKLRERFKGEKPRVATPMPPRDDDEDTKPGGE